MALQEHTLALVRLAWTRAFGLPDDALSAPPDRPAFGAPHRVEVRLDPRAPLPGEASPGAAVLQLGLTTLVAGPDWFLTSCRPLAPEELALESTLLRLGAAHGVRSRGERVLYCADAAPEVAAAQSIAVSFDSSHALEVGALSSADDVAAAGLARWGGTASLVPVSADDAGGGVACAAAGYDVFSGLLARLGVLTVPRLRGKGLGTYAAASAMESAWLDGLVPAALVPEGQTAARHIAVAVGMEPVGTYTVVGWDRRR